MKKSSRANLLFTLFVLVLAGALLLGTRLLRPAPGAELIGRLQYGRDAQILDIPLDVNKRYDIQSGSYTIHLEVRDGAIAFVDSPCPDHVCEGYGWLDEPGEWAACLPAYASLSVVERS